MPVHPKLGHQVAATFQSQVGDGSRRKELQPQSLSTVKFQPPQSPWKDPGGNFQTHQFQKTLSLSRYHAPQHLDFFHPSYLPKIRVTNTRQAIVSIHPGGTRYNSLTSLAACINHTRMHSSATSCHIDTYLSSQTQPEQTHGHTHTHIHELHLSPYLNTWESSDSPSI